MACLVWQTPPRWADAAGEGCVSHLVSPGLLSYSYKYLPITLIIMLCCFHSMSWELRPPDSGESGGWCYNGYPLTRCASPQIPSASASAQESEIACLQAALQSEQPHVYPNLNVSILRCGPSVLTVCVT